MAALVVAGQAIIPGALLSQEQAIVKVMMCLYALEIADGRLPGSYSDAQARAYARAAAVKRN